MIRNYKLGESIKKNPTIYNYLRDESSQYKYLYRDFNYLKSVEQLAKEKYKLRPIDKLEKIKKNINLINAFLDVMN